MKKNKKKLFKRHLKNEKHLNEEEKQRKSKKLFQKKMMTMKIKRRSSRRGHPRGGLENLEKKKHL
jgi:hypothetical protein